MQAGGDGWPASAGLRHYTVCDCSKACSFLCVLDDGSSQCWHVCLPGLEHAAAVWHAHWRHKQQHARGCRWVGRGGPKTWTLGGWCRHRKSIRCNCVCWSAEANAEGSAHFAGQADVKLNWTQVNAAKAMSDVPWAAGASICFSLPCCASCALDTAKLRKFGPCSQPAIATTGRPPSSYKVPSIACSFAIPAIHFRPAQC